MSPHSPLRCARFGSTLAFALMLVARAARAGESQRELEPDAALWIAPSLGDEALLGEDTSWHTPRGVHKECRLTLAARWSRTAAGDGLEALALLTVPFDRWFADRAVVHPGSHQALADDAGDSRAPAGQGGGAPSTQRARPAPSSAAPSVARSGPELARAAVRAAWKAAGLGADDKLDALASRARTSAALPELRLRAARTTDESGKLTYLDADTPHYAAAGSASYWLEARLTYRLDRLIFADEEVSIERVRFERVEARERLAFKVLKSLFDWQRARTRQREPDLLATERLEAEAAEAEAAATLEVLTGGWFEKIAANDERRSPDDSAP